MHYTRLIIELFPENPIYIYIYTERNVCQRLRDSYMMRFLLVAHIRTNSLSIGVILEKCSTVWVCGSVWCSNGISQSKILTHTQWTQQSKPHRQRILNSTHIQKTHTHAAMAFSINVKQQPSKVFD